tara:strand:- start:4835 stop:5077 length:243 start_codon:yes stop_codon:yes gene_type:complete
MCILKEFLNGVLLVVVFAFLAWLPDFEVQNYECKKLAVGCSDYESRRAAPAENESDRDGTARERSQRPERVIAFTFTRTI